jgi:hypothetical protein
VRWNATDRATTFISATEVRASILAADVAGAGTAAVTVFSPAPGGGTSGPQTFTVNPASPNNPVPFVSSLSPQTAAPGGATFNLTVNGSGFVAASVVYWNGAARTTTYLSSSQVRASIPAADIASAGLAAVTVVSPAPGGGSSLSLPFFIQNASYAWFFDGFNRPDSDTVGNSWTEKEPAAFALQANELISFNTGLEFMQNIMYRPSGEDRLDTEAAVELRRLPNVPDLYLANFPQLHMRVQRQNLTQFNTLDSYIFFIDELSTVGPRAMFAVSRSPNPGVRYECYIAPLPLPSALVEGSRYRLRLRVTGTAPVLLQGTVEQFSAGGWNVLASGAANHAVNTPRDPSLFCDGNDLPAPITTAGGAAVSKWTNRTDVYDNFYWREVADPAVVISALSPSSLPAGSPDTDVRVLGSGFTPEAVARWNGAARTTTYVSATEVRARILATDLAAPTTASVTVLLPSSGLTSNTAAFTVLPAGGGTFADSFDRADNAALGNGWIEKAAAAFSLAGNRVLKNDTPGGDYRNNIVYRPAVEDLLDAEASVEMRVLSQPVGYPQVMVRVQSATAAQTNRFDGYLLYIPDNASQAVLSRQVGASYDTVLATFNLSQALNTTDTYRLRLSATGTGVVRLLAYVERWTGTAWQILGQTSYDDASAQRIQAAGSVGFGGYVEAAYAYDNFRRIPLAP